MAVTGVIKETTTSTGYTKTYGLSEYKILGANLSNKKLKELGFYVKEGEEEKERQFVKEEDGVKRVQIEFACSDAEGRLRRFSFFIKDGNARNPTEKERALYTYINSQGIASWSLKPDVYDPINPASASFFTGNNNEYEPRPAKWGEEQFMLFMRTAMRINYKEGGTIKYNLKKFFNNNFKELQEDLQTDYLGTILVATTITVKTGDDGIKEIESFYPYAFAPGDAYKVVKHKKVFTDVDIDAIHEKIAGNVGKRGKERTYVTPLEKMIAKMTDKDYPCKEVYHLGVVKTYVSDNHVEASSSAIIQDEDGDSSGYDDGDSSGYDDSKY